jgi:hypothetical protein
MTEPKQAMEKALEALEQVQYYAELSNDHAYGTLSTKIVTDWAPNAIAALRAALSSLPDVQTGLSDEQIMRHGYAAIRSDRPIPKEADTWEFYDDELIAFARAVLSAASAPKEPQ